MSGKTKRVDPSRLFSALVLIDSHYGMTVPEMADDLGVSESTMRRILCCARNDYGMAIEYYADGWAIVDWGVFDKRRILTRSSKYETD